MHTRSLCGQRVSAVSLGCMNLSHAYGAPPSREEGIRVIRRALELGVTHFDTATLYGFGRNEELVGAALGSQRHDVLLASKCGMAGVDGKRVIDGRPETLRSACEASLRRLGVDHIDLYYLHRVDPQVPVEDSVGALGELVRAGLVRHVGLSEISAGTLRRAHAVHPIAAVQSEFSVWTRNPIVGVLAACRELGSTFVAFSPLARGFFTDSGVDPAQLLPKDIRRGMPRFQPPHFERNVRLRTAFAELAQANGLTAAQLALAWALAQDPTLIALPGTTSLPHLEENIGAADVVAGPTLLAAVERIVNPDTVSGARYNAETQAEIDTEELPQIRS